MPVKEVKVTSQAALSETDEAVAEEAVLVTVLRKVCRFVDSNFIKFERFMNIFAGF